MRAAELAEDLLQGPEPDPCLDLAQELLEDQGFEVDRRQEAGALLATRGPPGGLVLSGHVDVVPAGQGWTSEPFGHGWEEDRLIGRGASDMRGSVACMLAALEATDAPAGLVLTSDEETTMDTARALVSEDALAGASLVVVGEPTSLDVASCGKGVAWLKLSVAGASGHASTPRGASGREPSAPERLVELLSELPTSPLRVTHPVLGSPTLAVSNLGCAQGPYNVLSPQAWAKLDCRFPAPATPQEVAKAVASSLGHPEDLTISLEKEEPAFETEPALAEQAKAAIEASGTQSQVIGVSYASEAGHWSQAWPTVICGPGSIERAHKAEEFITDDELAAGARAYQALVEAWAPS